MMQPHGMGVLYFSCDAETAASQSASQPVSQSASQPASQSVSAH
jgi:hypothetical protein